MLAAQLAHVARGQVALHGDGGVLLAVHDAQHGQVAHRRQRLLVVGTEHRGAAGDHLLHVRACLGQFAQVALYGGQVVGGLQGGRIPLAGDLEQSGTDGLDDTFRPRSVAAGRDHLRLRQFQLDPHAVVGGQREGARQRLLQHALGLVDVRPLQQRLHLVVARAQRLRCAVAEVRGAMLGHPAEQLGGLIVQTDRSVDARHGLAQADGHVGLVGEIAGDRGFRVGEQLTVHQVARQVAGTGLGQGRAERVGGHRVAFGHLSRQTLGQANAHGLDVDPLQHRLLERGHLLQLRAARFGQCALRARLLQTVQGQRQSPQQSDQREARGDGRGAVAAQELAPHVGAARRYRRHGAPLEIALQVVGQRRDGPVAGVPIVLHGLQHDPVQIAAQAVAHARQRQAALLRHLPCLLGRQRRQPRRRRDGGRRFRRPGLAHGLGANAAHQFAQHHAQRVHVAARVHLPRIAERLLGTHVLRRAGALQCGVAGQRRGHRDAEIDDLRCGPAIQRVHQQVARLQVTVDHALVVRVLHALADADEQRHAFVQRQPLLPTVARDRTALDQLHREEGIALLRGAGIVDLGDGRMAHLRQHLPLHFEPGQVAGLQALRAHQLQGHFPAHRFQLGGAIDLAHAAATQQALDAVVPQARPGRHRAVGRGRRILQARGQALGGCEFVVRLRCHSTVPCAPRHGIGSVS